MSIIGNVIMLSMGTYAPILPVEYQEVEYLESTGIQHIETDYIPKTTTQVTIDKFAMYSTTQSWGVFVGSMSADNAQDTFVFRRQRTNDSVNFMRTAGGGGVTVIAVTPLAFYKVDCNQYYFIVGSSVVVAESPKNGIYPLYLFAGNLAGEPWRNSISRIGRVTITEDFGAILRFFIPCYRRLDSKPGFYDIINDTFLTNAGTGEFTVGPDV